MSNAFETKQYTNVFATLGYTEEAIVAKIEACRDLFFYGPPEKCNYYLAIEDMGYIVDTGIDEVRTEGMSYGMLICVQLDMKRYFDWIWQWTKTYMWMPEGENRGYFAWSVRDRKSVV